MREPTIVTSSHDPPYSIGMTVEHPKRPQWGPGRILDINGEKLVVYFRDLPETKAGDAVKTINPAVVPLRVAESQADPQLDNLPAYKNGRFAAKKRRMTFEQALEFFRGQFPLLFKDPGYLSDPTIQERSYKIEAGDLFNQTLGREEIERLLASEEFEELRQRASKVLGKLNLLSTFERLALEDGLKSGAAARGFFQALMGVLEAETVSQDSYGRLIGAVERLPVKRSRTATWPILTLFPFIAQPERHMFLKPDSVKRFADHIAFDLQYRTALNWTTYSKLIEMSGWLFERLKPYGARDSIDVQSFIWVVSGPQK